MELNKKRPHKVNEDLHSQEVEKNFRHYDELFESIQSGRVTSFTGIEAGSTDADSIVTLLAAVNDIIAKLNQSVVTK